MKKTQFQRDLMRKTITYLVLLMAVVFVITGYLYGVQITTTITEANSNFLSLIKTQTEHFIKHPHISS